MSFLSARYRNLKTARWPARTGIGNKPVSWLVMVYNAGVLMMLEFGFNKLGTLIWICAHRAQHVTSPGGPGPPNVTHRAPRYHKLIHTGVFSHSMATQSKILEQNTVSLGLSSAHHHRNHNSPKRLSLNQRPLPPLAFWLPPHQTLAP